MAVCSIVGEPCCASDGTGMPMRRPLKLLTAFSHWVVFAEHVPVYGDQLVTGDVRLVPSSLRHIKSMQEHKP